MQRIIVDLPEPDGPITTTTSWRPTLRLMSFERLEVAEALVARRSSSIIDSPCRRPAWRRRTPRRGARCSLIWRPTPSLRSSRWLSRAIVNDPTQNMNATNVQRLDDQALAAEVVLLGDRRRTVEQLEDAHRHAGQRGVLEQRDELADLRRDHVAQRLGQHDEGVWRDRRQPERLGRLGLPAGDRLQTAAHDLGHVRRGEQREHDDRPHRRGRGYDRAGRRSRGRRWRAAAARTAARRGRTRCRRYDGRARAGASIGGPARAARRAGSTG